MCMENIVDLLFVNCPADRSTCCGRAQEQTPVQRGPTHYNEMLLNLIPDLPELLFEYLTADLGSSLARWKHYEMLLCEKNKAFSDQSLFTDDQYVEPVDKKQKQRYFVQFVFDEMMIVINPDISFFPKAENHSWFLFPLLAKKNNP